MSNLVASDVGAASAPGALLGVTIGDLVERTRRLCYGSRWPALDKLAAAVTSSTANAIQLTYATDNVRAGSWLGIDYEDLYGWDNPDGSKNVSVERGQRGTDAATHASGALVEVDPRFSRGQILQTLEEEIQSWSRDLYAVAVVDLSAGSTDDALDLDGSDGRQVFRVLGAWRDPLRSEERWTPVETQLLTRQSTTDFASGYAVTFRPLGYTATLRVAYAYDFNLAEFDPGLDLSVLGLSSHMADIAPYGAAWRLLTADEANRTDDQAAGRSRRAEEVPPTSRLRAGQGFLSIRNSRLTDERRRLLEEFGWGFEA